MRRSVRFAFWVEAALAGLTALLAVLTVAWRDWVESVFGFDPDHHNGSFEWELVAVCCVATIVFSLLARREYRRAALATT
jgi:hypothetical protein